MLRTATPARLQAGAQRAVAKCIQVRQLANPGSDVVANKGEVTGNIAPMCDSLAGLNEDLVCKNRATF